MRNRGIFLLLAILAVASIMGIGIAIAEQSVILTLFCILAIIVIMGFGFTLKKKMRENENL